MRQFAHDLSPLPLWRSDIGWRARIGIIYIGNGWIPIDAFNKIAPKGVAMGGLGVPRHKNQSAEEMLKLDDMVPELVKQFVSYSPDVILWNDTAASFMRGKEYDVEFIKMMEESTGGIKCTTTSTSLCQAFTTMKVSTLAMVTPYAKEVNEKEIKYFGEQGFNIVNCVGLDLMDPYILANVSSSVLYKLARMADVPEADGMFISCTGIDSLDIIEPLEQDLGKPVFTSNQSAFWNALRLAKIGAPIEGYGSLLSLLPRV